MEKKQVIKSVKGNQYRRKNIYMLKDTEPNQKVKGDLGGNANPEALKNIEIIMDKVFEFVSRQRDVTDIDLLSFMRQIGITQQSEGSSFQDDFLARIIQAMVFDQRLEQTTDGYYRAVKFKYPSSLAQFQDSKTASNSRIVYTEIPCAHCPLSQ